MQSAKEVLCLLYNVIHGKHTSTLMLKHCKAGDGYRAKRGVPACKTQEKFKHYRDLWRLNLETWRWEQLPGKGGPCGRSGHRMALHGNRLVLFGGFADTGKDTACACLHIPTMLSHVGALHMRCADLKHAGAASQPL